MAHTKIGLGANSRWVVGSIGSTRALRAADVAGTLAACDVAEIRLDLLNAELVLPCRESWAHLVGVPLLFTARRKDEGGAGDLDACQRMDLLRAAMADAALLDIELASLEPMRDLVTEATARGVPWMASFHDFEKLPATALLETAARRAQAAGAAAFKVAARLNNLADLVRLAEFQLSNQGLPLATMGMGALAPVSRLLCAQCGSVLNYGYLGESPTAPGQWDSRLLRQAISQLHHRGNFNFLNASLGGMAETG